VERVASDLLGLTTAVTDALTRALKSDLKGADPVLIKKWCEFYSEELLPQTRSMVKKTAPKLDAFGLFLPSRMGPTLSQDLLQKGLKLDESSGTTETADSDESSTTKKDASDEEEKESDDAENEANVQEDDDVEEAAEDVGNDVEEIDEYEYDDEEEYYDDEDEL